MLAAFGVRFLLERLPRRPGRALALLLCGLVVVDSENYRPVPLVAFEIPPSLQTANAWLRTRPPGAVLTLPAIGHRQGGDYDGDLRAMYGTLTHRHPVMNGATGFHPPLYWFFNSSGALESFDNYDYGDVLRGLRVLGVRYVIVQTDPALADAEKGRATLRAIRRQPDQIVTSRNFGETAVFELPPWGRCNSHQRAQTAADVTLWTGRRSVAQPGRTDLRLRRRYQHALAQRPTAGGQRIDHDPVRSTHRRLPSPANGRPVEFWRLSQAPCHRVDRR